MLKLSRISDAEKTLLHDHRKKSQTALIRERAHAILLLSEGRSIPDVASILFAEEDTVRGWFHKFEKERVGSLFPRYTNNNNAGKLTKEQKKEISETLEKPPSEYGIPGSFWSVSSLKEYLTAHYGVVYESDRSYHHLFEVSRFSYKLPEAFDKRRNDALVEERMSEIHEEIKQYNFPEWECFAADESSIVWETDLKRAWLKTNKKTVIKADRTKQRQNYFGALNLNTGKHSLIPLTWQNTQTIIGALRVLTKNYPGKKLCIIWDNARWHRAKALREMLGPKQEFEHIRFVWLPPYAPDKNPEEHVWKFGKEALSNRVYASFTELTQAFASTLANQFFHYKFS